VLDQGMETIIDSHCRFYVLSKMDCTLTLVEAEEQQPPQPPQQHQQQQQQGATSTPPAAKRQRRCGAGGALPGEASEAHQFQLLAVRCVPRGCDEAEAGWCACCNGIAHHRDPQNSP
jgi:hypothetical protein